MDFDRMSWSYFNNQQIKEVDWTKKGNSIVKQWIEQNRFENVFELSDNYLVYKNIQLIHALFSDVFFMALQIMHITNCFDDIEYKTIEEVLFVIDEYGVFKNDLKWKMMITILKERQAL